MGAVSWGGPEKGGMAEDAEAKGRYRVLDDGSYGVEVGEARGPRGSLEERKTGLVNLAAIVYRRREVDDDEIVLLRPDIIVDTGFDQRRTSRIT